MNIKIVERKLIKPSTPTPPNLRNYRISYIDEMIPDMDVAVLLFYKSKPKNNNHLEESLAKILTQFYPLAGRYISKDRTVDCSDQGVEFIEAEASDAVLADIVGASTAEELNYVLPRITQHHSSLLSIQITSFQCGGAAIGISISHKICDASSLATLIAAWANATNPAADGEFIPIVVPSFETPSWFPPKTDGSIAESLTAEAVEDCVVKRFVFDGETIARMRSKLKRYDAGEAIRISRVRVVTAVLAKALMGVDRARNGGMSRPCIIAQSINMRERTSPPLHKHACGNLAMQSCTRRIDNVPETGVEQVVRVLGEAIDEAISVCAGILGAGEDVLNNLIVKDEMVLSGEQSVVFFTDYSKFGFYEADFGWGKPVWVGAGALPAQDLVLLMDNAGRDGIEAWVHLKKDQMPYFEQELANILKLSNYGFFTQI